MILQVGTVIRWNNFPDPRYGTEIKPRWFIYLGRTDSLSNPIIIHIATTTTQLQHFESGGIRANHSHYKFSSKDTPFDEDCILDYEEKPYPVEQSIFEGNPDIEIKELLNENKIRMIYNQIRESNAYSKVIKLDIHRCLNNDGITGLKMP